MIRPAKTMKPLLALLLVLCALVYLPYRELGERAKEAASAGVKELANEAPSLICAEEIHSWPEEGEAVLRQRVFYRQNMLREKMQQRSNIAGAADKIFAAEEIFPQGADAQRIQAADETAHSLGGDLIKTAWAGRCGKVTVTSLTEDNTSEVAEVYGYAYMAEVSAPVPLLKDVTWRQRAVATAIWVRKF